MSLGWFPLVLIYIATNSVSKTVQKLSLKNEEVDSTAFCALFMFTVSVISIPFLFFEEVVFSVDIRAWTAVLSSALLYSACMVLFFHAMKLIEISQVETVATTRSIWAMFLGTIFFQEALSLSKFIGVILIFFGLAVIYWEKGKFNSFKKPHLYTLAYAFLISCAYALDKYALYFFSVVMYQVIIYSIPAVLIVIFQPGTLAKIKPLLKAQKSTYLILLCSCFQMTSTLALYRAYQTGGEYSVVGPLTQLTTILNILIGITILKERWHLKQKILGISLAVLGVVFIKVLYF
ncbi:MAG: EamA family transporter [Bacillota bacterium]|jgi:drug/metabolite transporter (DMT)-like permease